MEAIANMYWAALSEGKIRAVREIRRNLLNDYDEDLWNLLGEIETDAFRVCPKSSMDAMKKTLGDI